MIIINGFEKENIINFEITKKVNSNSECSFEFIISDVYEKYLGMVNKDLIINNEDDYLFYGYIDKVSAEPNSSKRGIFIKIHAFSYSKLIDITPKQRIFQNSEKDFNEIINIIKSKTKSEINSFVDEKIPYPVLQNNETDFCFILRLAKTYGSQLFVDDIDINQKYGKFKICKYSDDSTFNLDERINSKREIFDKSKFIINSEDKKKKINKLELVLNNQYIDLGRVVKYENNKKYVAEIKIELDKYNLYKYHYVLYDLESLYEFDRVAETKPVSLKAIVTDNNDNENKGRIKVKFDCDFEDAEPEKQMWINWQTPYMAEKGGFIFVPEKGDVVEVIYNNDEFVATQIIARKSLDDKFKNVKDKYIANIFGRIIIFKEKELELISGENKIVMGDDSILLQVNNKAKIVIKENKIELQAGKTNMTLGDDVRVESSNIKANGSSIELNGSSSITLKGGNIYLN